MTGNWRMSGKNVVNLGDPSRDTDASNKKRMLIPLQTTY